MKKLPIKVVPVSPPEQVRANYEHNAALDWPQLEIQEPHGRVGCVMGGGPSVRQFISTLKTKDWDFLACNDSIYYFKDEGIPVKYNAFFDSEDTVVSKCLRQLYDDVTYLIGASVHPSVTEYFKDIENKILWHPHSSMYEVKEGALPVTGGSTIVLRSLYLMLILGYRDIRVFGFDCSFDAAMSHAYRTREQHTKDCDRPNQIKPIVVDVCNGDRTFTTDLTYIAAIHDALAILPHITKYANVSFYGDALAQNVISTGLPIMLEEENDNDVS
jgi:hypothetical protein